MNMYVQLVDLHLPTDEDSHGASLTASGYTMRSEKLRLEKLELESQPFFILPKLLKT